MKPCTNLVNVATRRDGSAVKVVCGTWRGGEQVFCQTCETKLHAAFPQGWHYYPGDTCKHGVYVGGCGVDLMCGRCESGEEE
jgi:hypothetical protein